MPQDAEKAMIEFDDVVEVNGTNVRAVTQEEFSHESPELGFWEDFDTQSLTQIGT